MDSINKIFIMRTFFLTIILCVISIISMHAQTDVVRRKAAPNATQRKGNMQSSSANVRSKTITVNGVSFDMVFVKAGTFTMGATKEQTSDDDDDDKPHKVTLTDDYYIGKTEVTQALWKAVMGTTPDKMLEENNLEYSSGDYPIGDNYPMFGVTWDDCKMFLSKLSAKTGKLFRLPTEAQWEYAARGGRNSRNYRYSGSDKANDVAWYEENSGDEIHIVATKHPNELGIYDMSGNVSEWCNDGWGSYGSEPVTNPKGDQENYNSKIIRGGSYSSSLDYYIQVNIRDCESASRLSKEKLGGLAWQIYRCHLKETGLRVVLVE